jgi:hypothetical protein
MSETYIHLLEQAEELFEPGRLDFIYRYGHDLCCADIFFSDGTEWRTWHVSNIFGDALQALMEALARLLPFEQEKAQAHWFHEPAETRWVLRRSGPALQITILSLPSFFKPLPDEAGIIRFQTTVDFQTFVQRVRLAASRIATQPAGGEQRQVSFDQDLAYRAVCTWLTQQKSMR